MDYFLTNNVVGADYQLTPFSFGLAHLINTIESHNGKLYADLDHGQGSVTLWFSRTDFGGTNYSNTPIGGVSYTDESGAYATLTKLILACGLLEKTLLFVLGHHATQPIFRLLETR